MYLNRLNTRHSTEQVQHCKDMLEFTMGQHIGYRLAKKEISYEVKGSYTHHMYYWQTRIDPFAHNAHSREDLVADIEQYIEFCKDTIYMRIDVMSVEEIQEYLRLRINKCKY
jgi:hypothetical protein